MMSVQCSLENHNMRPVAIKPGEVRLLKKFNKNVLSNVGKIIITCFILV